MTNTERAAEIMRKADRKSATDPDINRYCYPDEYAQALADATPPLLMPDLPKPTDRDVPEWESPSNEHHAVSVEQGGTVRIWGDTSGYTPKESRDLALALLAAANYAERNQA